jgi:hypothetical protein
MEGDSWFCLAWVEVSIRFSGGVGASMYDVCMSILEYNILENHSIYNMLMIQAALSQNN